MCVDGRLLNAMTRDYWWRDVCGQAAAERNALLLEDNRKDERLLRQLEKNLKMKKRKSNSLPMAFVNDGLHCILLVSMYFLK